MLKTFASLSHRPLVNFIIIKAKGSHFKLMSKFLSNFAHQVLTPPENNHFPNCIRNDLTKLALTARIKDSKCNNDVTFLSPTFREAQVPSLFVTNSGQLDSSTPPLP